MRLLALTLTFAALACQASSSTAAVITQGDVDPTPDANGGTISGTLTVADGANNGNTFVGSVSIDDGTDLNSNDGVIGNRLGAIGTVSVSGPNSQWDISDDLAVGQEGYGELFISSQGRVNVNDDSFVGNLLGGRGWVTVEGSGTVFDVADILSVGTTGLGSLAADDRGRIISNSGVLGAVANSNGTAAINGQASWRVKTDLAIGDAGFGSLVVSEGGLVENTTARVTAASSGQGTVTVTDPGSVWLNRNDLFVGDRGPGSVNIADAGHVQVLDVLTIQRRGQVHLDGGLLSANSISNLGVLEGGGSVRATITNSSTGSIRGNAEEPLVLGSVVTNNGTMDAVDGEINFRRETTNGTSGLIAARDGILRFDSGLTNNGKLGFSTGESDVFGVVTNSATGTVQVGGDGTATFYDDFANAGTLSVEPKASAVFLGDVLIAGEGAVALAGLAVDQMEEGVPTRADPLTVAGQLSVSGALELQPSRDPLDLTEPVTRGESTTVNLITADTLTGTFGRVIYDFAALNADIAAPDGGFRSLDDSGGRLGMFRSVTYSETSVDLTSYLAIEGDANGDGNVDFSDFLTLSANFDQTGDWLSGDFDGDGAVLFSDFLVLAQNFGIEATTSVESIPEPASQMLVIVVAASLFLQIRRGQDQSWWKPRSSDV